MRYRRFALSLAPPATTRDAMKRLWSRHTMSKNSSNLDYALCDLLLRSQPTLRCIRCAGRNVVVTHHTHHQPAHHNSLPFRLFFSVSLFPCFLSGSHSFFNFYENHSLFCCADRYSFLAALIASSVYFDIRSLATSALQSPTSIRQDACPQLQRHAFEQDVPWRPCSPGYLHDLGHWHLLQLHPDDCHNRC